MSCHLIRDELQVHRLIHPETSTNFISYLGVSKNRGTPKRMVYNGKTLLKWMIWGYHYFRKHPSISQRRNKGSKWVAVPACNLKLCLDQVDACDFLWQIKIQQTFWNPHCQNKDACGNYWENILKCEIQEMCDHVVPSWDLLLNPGYPLPCLCDGMLHLNSWIPHE